jgi:hypothetical protein
MRICDQAQDMGFASQLCYDGEYDLKNHVDTLVECEMLVEQRSIYIHLCVGICKHSNE